MNTDKIYAQMIAAEYAPKTNRKVIALRKLDRHIKRPIIIFSYVFGLSMLLLYGVGSVFVTREAFAGLFAMMAGLFGMALNCPMHEKLLQKVKQRNAIDILVLAQEICEEASV